MRAGAADPAGLADGGDHCFGFMIGFRLLFWLLVLLLSALVDAIGSGSGSEAGRPQAGAAGPVVPSPGPPSGRGWG